MRSKVFFLSTIFISMINFYAPQNSNNSTCNTSLALTRPSNSTFPPFDPNACPPVAANFKCGNSTIPLTPNDCNYFHRVLYPNSNAFCCFYTGIALGHTITVCEINTPAQISYFTSTYNFQWTVNGVLIQAYCRACLISVNNLILLNILLLIF